MAAALLVATTAAGMASGEAPSDRAASKRPGSSGPSAGQFAAARDAAAHREAWLDTPRARAARSASKREFANRDAGGALSVAKEERRDVMDAPVWNPLRLASGTRATYLDDFSARVRSDDGHRGVAVSMTPLRSDVATGGPEPLDLHLERQAGGFQPANPVTPTSIPPASSGEVRVGELGIHTDTGAGKPGVESTDKVFYANTDQDVDTIVMPVPTGVETFYDLRSQDSPEDFALSFDLPEGTGLRAVDGGRAAEITTGDAVVASIPAAVATDAQKQPVPVAYQVDGSTLHVHVLHRSADVAYPVMVDPIVNYTWEGSPARTTNTSWGNFQSRSTPWCKLFINWAPGSNGLWTYGSSTTTAPCYGSNYTYPEAFEWNYYGEYNRWIQYGTLGYVYGFQEYATFNRGSGNMCRYSGIYSVGKHQWENIDPDPNDGIPPPSNNTCDQTNEGPIFRSYCTYSDCGHPSRATPPNYAVFGTGTTYPGQNASFTNYLQAASIYVADDTPATVDAGSPGIPASWVDSATFSGHAHSSGLGLTSLKLTSSATPAFSPTSSASCSADPANHCPPDRTISSSTAALNEGVNAITASANDVMGRPTVSGTIGQVKVDRSPPTSAASGPLWDDRNVDYAGGTVDSGWIDSDESVTVAATDGSSAAPRSGVASIEMLVDHARAHPEDLAAQSCPSGQCPYSASATFTFHPSEVTADSDHTIDLVVRDELADPTSVTPGPHVTVTTFNVYVPATGDTADDQPADAYEPPPPDVDPNAAPSADADDATDANDLTTAQTTAAQSRVSLDAANPTSDLSKVLGLSTYHVRDTGTLVAGQDPVTGRDVNAGALVLIDLDQPRANVDATLPTYREQATVDSFVFFRAHLVASQLEDLLITVDLQTNQITGIEPGPDSIYTVFGPVAGTGSLPPEPPDEEPVNDPPDP